MKAIYLVWPNHLSPGFGVFVTNHSDAKIESEEDLLSHLREQPSPILLRRKRKEFGVTVVVETVGRFRLDFGYSPPSSKPEEDMNAVLSWFQAKDIAIEVVK